MLSTLLLSTLALCSAQTIDESLLADIFGTPPPANNGNAPSTEYQRLEDITVRPTDMNTAFTDSTGSACQCVPYYLCDNGVASDNASVTGWGTLDVRFGEDKCQESVEVCCQRVVPSDRPPVTPPPRPVAGCGVRNPQGLDFSITGGSGKEAQFGEFPWVIALQDNLNDTYIGVGVLIHPSVVLTAGHVVFGRNRPGAIKIRAGEWDTATDKERLRHETRVISEVVIHERIRPKTLWNDIALLRLDTPLELQPHINTVCLPRGVSSGTGRGCVANGWGKDVFGQPGRYAVILKKVEVDMVPHQQCNELLRRTRLGHKFNLDSSFVCAGGEEGKDTCSGDGGAPLACPSSDGSYTLEGLVAWGIGCGQKDVPAVYVNVPAFRSWIDDKMAAWGYEV